MDGRGPRAPGGSEGTGLGGAESMGSCEGCQVLMASVSEGCQVPRDSVRGAGYTQTV